MLAGARTGHAEEAAVDVPRLPAAIEVVYPTGGQSGFGYCWQGLSVDRAGNLYPSNGPGIYRLLPDGTLVNGVGDTNFFINGPSDGALLDESRSRFFSLHDEGVFEAPFTEGGTFSLLASGNGTLFHTLTRGRGPLADSLLASEGGHPRIYRVTLSPPGSSLYKDSGLITFPQAMASAPDGTLYVVSTSRPDILPQLIRIGTDGTESVFAEGTFHVFNFVNTAVAVDDHGYVYWSRAEGMAKYDPSGQLLGLLPAPPDTGAFRGPAGAVFDAQGRLFVLDGCKKIYRYTFPPIPVGIDIKPDEAVNEVNPRSQGKLKVALLSADTFDATQVDLETIRFGATGAEAPRLRSWVEDVNGDGRLDTVLAFEVQDTQLTCASTSAVLSGSTQAGERFQGSDAVVPTGCNGP
jgi:hypothetical protein